MGAVTYPDAKVIQFISDVLVPVQVLFDHKPLAERFKLVWTPTLITLDTDGQEHHRTVGFLPPEELIPSLLLGMGKSHFERDEFAEAIARFEKLLKEFPTSRSSPEAAYFLGVAGYKNTHDPKHLRVAYDRLKAEFPNSDWAQRATPYSLIN